MEKTPFDIAVLGAGCSGFQLLHQLSLQPDFKTKKVAIFSDEIPQKRSWCFWSNVEEPLQHLVSKSWHKITFKGRDFIKTEDVYPYKYHYIAGDDFFNYFNNDFLIKNKNIELINHEIKDLKKEGINYTIKSTNNHWESEKVFSSLPSNATKSEARFHLKQHFKGLFVKSEKPIFDESTVMLMDFSIPQQNDTRFVYILPFSPNEALIEITVFSPDTYADSDYDNALTDYFTKHYADINFTIQETEKGQIPMTDALFSRFGTEGETLLGTSAGIVKASTGYAFRRITRDSRQLSEDLNHNKKPRWATTKGRFRWYDRLLLGILKEEPLKGSLIFETLFKRMKMTTIFRFLDEETHLFEEILLFSKLPFAPFLKQVFKQAFN
jgi:lycopene beta-cyclase